jgi:aldehyde dehydrogenase (NAD+)/aldehyde dehydrogenase
MELKGDILPAGVLNIVTGFGAEAGQALATSKRIAKLSFTGSTETGRKVYHNAAESIIPVTMELGGKSPNIFFPSVADEDDKFFSKCVEGALMFALNQGEICTTPSRILVHEDIADLFIERMQARLKLVKAGNPLDPETMIGSQASKAQWEKILNYINIGKEEGAVVLAGGEAGNYEGDLSGGYYVQPTVLKGTNNMRVFQEEIFGPVVALTTFSSTEEAIAIANDTPYGLGARVWSRDAHELFQVPRAIHAGRVWVKQYNTYPAHAPFGGVKESGFGRENHKMALDHYRVVKNMLISYDKDPVGFF